MAHKANIHEDAIFSELDSMAGGDQPQPPPGGQLQGQVMPAQEIPQEYIAIGIGAAAFFANRIAPNWEIDKDLQMQWAQAFAEFCEGILPGGVVNFDKWPAWAKLLYASGCIAMCGFDFASMSIKPLHPPEQQQASQPHQAQAAAADYTKPSAGSFSTAGAPANETSYGSFSTAGG